MKGIQVVGMVEDRMEGMEMVEMIHGQMDVGAMDVERDGMTRWEAIEAYRAMSWDERNDVGISIYQQCLTWEEYFDVREDEWSGSLSLEDVIGMDIDQWEFEDWDEDGEYRELQHIGVSVSFDDDELPF